MLWQLQLRYQTTPTRVDTFGSPVILFSEITRRVKGRTLNIYGYCRNKTSIMLVEDFGMEEGIEEDGFSEDREGDGLEQGEDEGLE